MQTMIDLADLYLKPWNLQASTYSLILYIQILNFFNYQFYWYKIYNGLSTAIKESSKTALLRPTFKSL
jgi:uncharacterized protein YcfL